VKAWRGKETALLLVKHVTQLDYAELAVEARTEVRKTPVDTGLQRVVTSKLDVVPPVVVRSHFDYFGTHVRRFNILEPHQAVTVTSESVVETQDAVCCGPEAPPDPRHWTQRLAEFLHASPAVPPLEEYAQIPCSVAPELAPEAFLDALRELGSTFRARFRHDPTATDVHSSPAVLFREGGGVCQDLAHAMLGVLRRADVPARYASGYVYDASPDEGGSHVQGASASHAWVHAWHPELGWVGVDPTNDRLVDWQYVRVAVGRDYTDVQPLRGVFVGGREQKLKVAVHVSRVG